MKNEKDYAGFRIPKKEQILERFAKAKTLANTSYFWGVDDYNVLIWELYSDAALKFDPSFSTSLCN